MKRMIISALCLIYINAYASSFIPTQSYTSDVSRVNRKRGLTFVQASSQKLEWKYNQGASALDLSDATTVLFTYVPSTKAWSQVVTGVVDNATNGQISVTFTPAQLNTNSTSLGEFRWRLEARDTDDTLAYTWGGLNLIEDPTSGITNNFPTSTNSIDWSEYDQYISTADNGPYRAGSNVTFSANTDGSVDIDVPTINTISNDLDTLEASYAVTSNNLNTVSNDLDTLEASYAITSNNLNTVSNDLDTLEASYAVTSNNLNTVSNDLDTLEASYAITSNNLNTVSNDLDTLEASYAVTSNNLNTVSNDLDTLEASYAITSNNLNTVSNDLDTLEASYAITSNNLNTVSNDLDTLEASYVVTSNNLNTVSNDLDTLEASYAITSNNLNTVSNDLDTLEASYAVTSNNLNTVSNDLDTLEASYAITSNNLNTVSNDLDTLEVSYAITSNNVNTVSNDLDTLEASYAITSNNLDGAVFDGVGGASDNDVLTYNNASSVWTNTPSTNAAGTDQFWRFNADGTLVFDNDGGSLTNIPDSALADISRRAAHQSTNTTYTNYFLGNVAIGTNNTVADLEVVEQSDNPLLYLTRDDNAIADGTVLGSIHFRGTDGGAKTGPQISGYATEAWGAAAAGSEITLFTVPNGDTKQAVGLHIDENQNTGAGTNVPAARLHVTGGTILADGGITNGGVYNAGGNINLRDQWLSGDGGDEGVFVDNVGDVGVGTNNPLRRFHVYGNSTDPLGVFENDGANGLMWDWDGGVGDVAFRMQSDNYYTIGYTTNYNGFVIAIGNNWPSDIPIAAYRLFISDSTGNVGIDTNSPAEKLHVNGDILCETDLHMNGGVIDDNAGRVNVDNTLYVTNGKVGIKNINPETILHIIDTNTVLNTLPLYINRSTANGDSGIRLRTATGLYNAAIGVDSSDSGQLKISAGATLTDNGIVIDQTNKVGIGTNDPAAKLHNNGFFSNELAIAVGGDATIKSNLVVNGSASISGIVTADVVCAQLFMDGTQEQNLTNDYSVITNMIQTNLVNFTGSDSNLIATYGGYYFCSFNVSFQGGTTETYEFAVHVDDVEQPNIEAQRKTSNNDIGSAGGSGILNLAAGESVTLQAKSLDAAANFDPDKVQIVLQKLN